jgi:hypothetical protein
VAVVVVDIYANPVDPVDLAVAVVKIVVVEDLVMPEVILLQKEQMEEHQGERVPHLQPEVVAELHKLVLTQMEQQEDLEEMELHG